MRTSRLLPLFVLTVLAALPAAAQAEESIGEPADTSRIQFVESTTTQEGFTWDLYRNFAYPCSISGYQSFAVGTRTGSDPNAPAPLWVRMRGGGVGFFDSTGKPQPSAGNKTEDSFAGLIQFADGSELNGLVNAQPEGFRNVSVSMCSHDLYAGANTPDPNNFNLTQEGARRPTTGLLATKAAIQFVQDKYPTSDTFLHGTSAGSAGTFHVAWAMQEQDRPITGFVADSGVVNQQSEVDQNNGGPCGRGTTTLAAIVARLDPAFSAVANQPDLLISDRRLEAPVFNVWNRDDQNACGETKLPCTQPDGSVQVIGGMECRMGRVSAAIAGLPASSGSRTMTLCVRAADQPVGDCSRHVVTGTKAAQFPNTDPAFPADYNAEILSWVRARLGDEPPELGVELGKSRKVVVRDGKLRLRCIAGGYERRECRVRVSLAGKQGGTIARGSKAIPAGGAGRQLKLEVNRLGREAFRDAGRGRGPLVEVRLKVSEEFTGRRGDRTRSYRSLVRG